MEQDYLNRKCLVKLVTGEELPPDVCYWGKSPMGEDMLWFVVPKERKVLETKYEYHIP